MWHRARDGVKPGFENPDEDIAHRICDAVWDSDVERHLIQPIIETPGSWGGIQARSSGVRVVDTRDEVPHVFPESPALACARAGLRHYSLLASSRVRK